MCGVASLPLHHDALCIVGDVCVENGVVRVIGDDIFHNPAIFVEVLVVNGVQCNGVHRRNPHVFLFDDEFGLAHHTVRLKCRLLCKWLYANSFCLLFMT